jgi:CheY-like chemotaxis protein/two-component sensor histidine kinase
MSHELRTPLNSLLLLAQSLVENKDKNLNDNQVESAEIIYESGNDLLNLINEILDLSKIEAGRMELKLTSVSLDELADATRGTFKHLAEEKELEFDVQVSEDLPQQIITDPKRLQQVIKNLVTNAIKFTESGSVHVRYRSAKSDAKLSDNGLIPSETICIEVEDTGIGIAKDKQKVIFEAFQQGDGGDTRRFGGTGLGLSIARELAALLGGMIRLESEPGKGSTFRLFIPLTADKDSKVPEQFDRPLAQPAKSDDKMVKADPPGASYSDDRELLQPGDKRLLVIEDDSKFIRLLHAHLKNHGFKLLAALTGEEGIDMALTYQPDGILLDIGLPKIDGWSVLRILKDDVRTRHIPVHIISVEEQSTEGLVKGAIGHVTKPISQEVLEATLKKIENVHAASTRRVLLVEDDNVVRKETARLISTSDIEVEAVNSGKKALDALKKNHFDLVILDLGLPDMDGKELLRRFEKEVQELPPVIIYTVRELSREEESSLRTMADSIILKDVRSQERLLDEVSLFLHWVVKDMPEDKRQIISELHETDMALKDKKVLVVDDDMRTAFVMSRLLSEHGMLPFKAENGEKAVQMLESNPEIDIVLMDVMMPVMDGYTAMQQIRKNAAFQNLPIIALTAKAMKEDRDKCMAAGANDYLPKPVKKERLLSMMRVWLYR